MAVSVPWQCLHRAQGYCRWENARKQGDDSPDVHRSNAGREKRKWRSTKLAAMVTASVFVFPPAARIGLRERAATLRKGQRDRVLKQGFRVGLQGSGS